MEKASVGNLKKKEKVAMLYHVSHQSGLKMLHPFISTHKKPYVYAINNMVTGLLFGAKQDDFDFMISTDNNEIPIIYECYPDALSKIYQGQSCSVYEVNEKGFKRGMTSWEPELVNENEVKVINEIYIENLYERLLKEETQGNLQIYRYEFSDPYRKQITSHIVDRIIRFDINLNKICEQDSRFSNYYRNIIQALKDIMDGHLLQ